MSGIEKSPSFKVLPDISAGKVPDAGSIIYETSKTADLSLYKDTENIKRTFCIVTAETKTGKAIF